MVVSISQELCHFKKQQKEPILFILISVIEILRSSLSVSSRVLEIESQEGHMAA